MSWRKGEVYGNVLVRTREKALEITRGVGAKLFSLRQKSISDDST